MLPALLWERLAPLTVVKTVQPSPAADTSNGILPSSI
jgi:hypothetical protein